MLHDLAQAHRRWSPFSKRKPLTRAKKKEAREELAMRFGSFLQCQYGGSWPFMADVCRQRPLLAMPPIDLNRDIFWLLGWALLVLALNFDKAARCFDQVSMSFQDNLGAFWVERKGCISYTPDSNPVLFRTSGDCGHVADMLEQWVFSPPKKPSNALFGVRASVHQAQIFLYAESDQKLWFTASPETLRLQVRDLDPRVPSALKWPWDPSWMTIFEQKWFENLLKGGGGRRFI